MTELTKKFCQHFEKAFNSVQKILISTWCDHMHTNLTNVQCTAVIMTATVLIIK